MIATPYSAPCARCGTVGGTTNGKRTTRERISAERFGGPAGCCRACYQQFSRMHRKSLEPPKPKPKPTPEREPETIASIEQVNAEIREQARKAGGDFQPEEIDPLRLPWHAVPQESIDPAVKIRTDVEAIRRAWKRAVRTGNYKPVHRAIGNGW